MKIITIKNFSIFKKDNKGNEKLPSYSISAKIGEEYVDLAAGWVKEGAKGKFISCQLANAWVNTQDNTKSRKAFCIVAEEDLIKLEEMAFGKEDHSAIDPETGVDLNVDREDPESIPF